MELQGETIQPRSRTSTPKDKCTGAAPDVPTASLPSREQGVTPDSNSHHFYVALSKSTSSTDTSCAFESLSSLSSENSASSLPVNATSTDKNTSLSPGVTHDVEDAPGIHVAPLLSQGALSPGLFPTSGQSILPSARPSRSFSASSWLPHASSPCHMMNGINGYAVPASPHSFPSPGAPMVLPPFEDPPSPGMLGARDLGWVVTTNGLLLRCYSLPLNSGPWPHESITGSMRPAGSVREVPLPAQQHPCASHRAHVPAKTCAQCHRPVTQITPPSGDRNENRDSSEVPELMNAESMNHSSGNTQKPVPSHEPMAGLHMQARMDDVTNGPQSGNNVERSSRATGDCTALQRGLNQQGVEPPVNGVKGSSSASSARQVPGSPEVLLPAQLASMMTQQPQYSDCLIIKYGPFSDAPHLPLEILDGRMRKLAAMRAELEEELCDWSMHREQATWTCITPFKTCTGPVAGRRQLSTDQSRKLALKMGGWGKATRKGRLPAGSPMCQPNCFLSCIGYVSPAGEEDGGKKTGPQAVQPKCPPDMLHQAEAVHREHILPAWKEDEGDKEGECMYGAHTTDEGSLEKGRSVSNAIGCDKSEEDNFTRAKVQVTKVLMVPTGQRDAIKAEYGGQVLCSFSPDSESYVEPSGEPEFDGHVDRIIGIVSEFHRSSYEGKGLHGQTLESPRYFGCQGSRLW